MTDSARPLTADEAAILRKILSAVASPGVEALIEQLPSATATGPVTFLELETTDAAPSPLTESPLPVDAIVYDDTGEPIGHMLVWIDDGYLSALEYAWFTEEMPTEMPRPDQVRVKSESASV